jgi:molecular chaperone GrpE
MSTDRPETIQYTETVMSEDTEATAVDQSMNSDAAMNADSSEPSVNPDVINQEAVPTMVEVLPVSEDEIANVTDAEQNAESVTQVDVGNDAGNDAEALTRLAAETESLRLQVEERTSQCVRIAADFDNFRKRTEREKSEIELRVKRDVISQLLPVIDSFEMSRTQIKPQTDPEVNIHKSYQGVYKQLVDGLKKIGVSPMRVEGQPFDPNFHDAIMREPTNEHPEGTVIEELRRGYLLGDLVLRHAMVKVAATGEDDDVPSEEQLFEDTSEVS